MLSAIGRSRSKRNGYTLIEMAIVFTVAGILIAAAIQAYNIYAKRKAIEVTEANTFTVVSALNNYLVREGRYPCPAPLDAPRDSAGYGFSIANNFCGGGADPANPLDPNVIAQNAAAAAATCGDGSGAICALYQGTYKLSATPVPGNTQRRVNINPQSSTDCRNLVDNAGVWVPVSGNAADCAMPVAWHGAVPFRELGIPEEIGEDGYGGRLVYVVSQNLTNTLQYRTDGGVISVVDEQNNPLVAPQGSAHFVVLSNGKDNVGSYSRAGNPMRACRDVIEDTTDALNCPASAGKEMGIATNQINTAAAPDVLVSAAAYRQSRAGHAGTGAALTRWFDDYIRFYSSSETPLWRVANNTGTNITDMAFDAAQQRSRVGVGFGETQGPASSFQVANTGALMADAPVKAAQICNENGTECFLVDDIGGTGFECGAGRFLRQIKSDGQEARFECTDDITLSCPAGNILQGIDAAGTLSCQAISSCAPRTVDMCNIGGAQQQYTLPAGVQGQTHTTPSFGASKVKTYRCDASQWTLDSESGVCECTPVNQQQTQSCTQAVPDGFWTGDTITQFTRVCPSGVETSVLISPPTTACTCVTGSRSQSKDCPVGFSSGSISIKRDWACNPAPNNKAPNGGYWQTPPGPSTPVNQVGTKYLPEIQGQPEWYVSANNCQCQPQSNQTRQRACNLDLPGWEGLYNQTSNFTCPNGASEPGENTPWTPVANLSNLPGSAQGCICNAHAQTLPPQNCPAGQIGSISKRRYLCCNPSVDPETSTPANECAGVTPGAYSPEFVITNTCAITSYQWMDIGGTNAGGGNIVNQPYPNQIGDLCTPNQNTGSNQCTQFVGNNQYMLLNCRCQ